MKQSYHHHSLWGCATEVRWGGSSSISVHRVFLGSVMGMTSLFVWYTRHERSSGSRHLSLCVYLYFLALDTDDSNIRLRHPVLLARVDAFTLFISLSAGQGSGGDQFHGQSTELGTQGALGLPGRVGFRLPS